MSGCEGSSDKLVTWRSMVLDAVMLADADDGSDETVREKVRELIFDAARLLGGTVVDEEARRREMEAIARNGYGGKQDDLLDSQRYALAGQGRLVPDQWSAQMARNAMQGGLLDSLGLGQANARQESMTGREVREAMVKAGIIKGDST